MHTLHIVPGSNLTELTLSTDSLKKELDNILDFAIDICEISGAFISIINENNNILISKRGLNNIENLNEITCFKELTDKQEILIISDTNLSCDNQLSDNKEVFNFFAGFPLKKINESISGYLCYLDTKTKELSSKELKILNQCVSQIESLLDLDLKNSILKLQCEENSLKFESLIENSNEIIYELTPEGIFNYISKNWTSILGYDINEGIGKSITSFIHPEDIEKCLIFLSNIKLNVIKNEEVTYRILHKDGYYVWHSSRINLIEKNNNPFYIGNCRDVSVFIETEQKLKQQKEFYEKILDRLPTDVAVFSPEHKYLYVNPIAISDEKLRKFIIGKDDIEYANHTKRNTQQAIQRQEIYKESVREKKILEWIETWYDKKGEISYHQRKFTPVFNNEGILEFMIGFSFDITESKKIQDELIKSRQFTKSIIENIAVGILVQGPQSEIIENNIAACEMLGLTQDQLLGKTSFDEYWQVIREDGTLFESEDHPVPQVIKHLKPVNNVVMGVHRPTKKDLVWLLVDAIPVFNESGEFLHVICSFNNITEQKNIEYDLKISNDRFINVTKATSDVIWDWDLSTDKIIVGENFTTQYGYHFQDNNNILTGQMIENLIHPNDRQRVNEKILLALKNHKEDTWTDEYRYLRADGNYISVKDKAHIVRNSNGEAIRMIGSLTDITIEKKLKDELESSEKKFKDIFDYSSVGIAMVNTDGYWMDANDSLCNILGYFKEDLKSLTFIDLSHPDDIEKELAYRKKLATNEIPFFQIEKRYIHKSGRSIWTNLSVSTVRNKNGKIAQFITQIFDISARKKIEEENRLLTEENNRNRNIQLNEAQNLYRLLADNTIDIVGLHDLNMNFVYVSPSVKVLIGYTPEEFIGKTPMNFAHPDDIKGMMNDLHKFISGNLLTPIQYRYLNAKGVYVWLETIAKLVLKDGKPYQVQTSTRDITQRKEAEFAIEKTLNRERELNELRTNLVSTISHEFRTPMTTIRTSAELIEMYIDGQSCGQSNQLRRQIHRITDEIDRIVELMNVVLTISKDDSGKTNFEPIQFDLKELCLNVIETSFSENRDGRKVETHIEGDNFIIHADKNLIQYSLFNILNNAFKYSEGSGKDVQLNLKSIKSEIQIEVIDFGIGIPEEDQPKLFNTFFRASNTDGIQGTGLGLYIVKTFIEKNSGKINLDSKLGKGTKITLELPKA